MTAKTQLTHTNHTRREFVLGALGALVAAPLALAATRALGSEDGVSAQTQAALDDAQARYDAAQAQLSALNDAAFDAQAAYDQTSTDLYYTNQQIDELQASIDEKQTELASAQDVLAQRVDASYRAGKTSMLDIVLSASSFDDFCNRIYYANKTSDADAQAIQNVKDIKASLEDDQAQLQQQQAAQEQLQAEQAEQLSTLQDQVAAAEDYVNSLDSEVQQLIAQKNAEVQAAAEAARQAAEAEAAAQAAAAQQASGAGAGTGASGSSEAAGGSADAGASGSGASSDAGSSDSGSGSSSGGSAGYQPASVVAAAYSYIGTPYSVLDCSGLTSAAYGDCGYSLYHQSGVQYSIVSGKGNLVGADGLVPGNLVFYARGGSIYHVGMYIGDGYVIDSIPNGGVQVRSLYFCDGFCGGGSPL